MTKGKVIQIGIFVSLIGLISYQFAPNARGLSKDDFEMYVVRVNVFENIENANALKENINNYFPAYTEALPNNNALTAVYVGPFVSESDIVNNMDTIKRLSESQNGEILRWKLSD